MTFLACLAAAWYLVDLALSVHTTERAYDRMNEKAEPLVQAAWKRRIA